MVSKCDGDKQQLLIDFQAQEHRIYNYESILVLDCVYKNIPNRLTGCDGRNILRDSSATTARISKSHYEKVHWPFLMNVLRFSGDVDGNCEMKLSLFQL